MIMGVYSRIRRFTIVFLYRYSSIFDVLVCNMYVHNASCVHNIAVLKDYSTSLTAAYLRSYVYMCDTSWCIVNVVLCMYNMFALCYDATDIVCDGVTNTRWDGWWWIWYLTKKVNFSIWRILGLEGFYEFGNLVEIVLFRYSVISLFYGFSRYWVKWIKV